MRLINSQIMFPKGGKRLPPAGALANRLLKAGIIPFVAESPRQGRQHRGSERR